MRRCQVPSVPLICALGRCVCSRGSLGGAFGGGLGSCIEPEVE